MAVEPVTLKTFDHESLEAQWDEPDDGAERAVVFCHPHPQQGGTMTAPLMRGVTKRLTLAGLAVLRFNFRGVGASTGSWGRGISEIHDVEAAVTHAEGRGLPLAIAGWSFGAATSLRWQAVEQSDLPWVGIAPPVPPAYDIQMPTPWDLDPAPRTVIMGDRDQLIDLDASRSYAESIGATFHVVEGSDHFFHFREGRVAELMVPTLTGAHGSGEAE